MQFYVSMKRFGLWMSWWIQTYILQKVCRWIFVLFRLSDYLEKFKNYLNSILPEPAMVSKHLSITNPPLVDHIYISSVSLLKNIKLVGFHSIIPKVSTCFRFSKILFRSRSFKRNIIKQRISYQIDW